MEKVRIIAEAGVNHNGNFDIAIQLIDCAKDCGCDYIKFQTFKADKLVSKKAKMAKYQIQNTNSESSQFEMLKKLELSEDEFTRLLNYSKSVGIGFLSTPFDLDSLEFLTNMNLDFIKLGSGDLTNLPLLENSAKKEIPIILSTGMASLKEVKDSLAAILNTGLTKEKVYILQCNTEYPTPLEDVNLNAMQTIQKELGVAVGFSDHTEGIECALAAVAMGAIVIEKHITLDKKMDGPDHMASTEPEEFKRMVKMIRNIEKAKGDGVKSPSNSEMKNISIARKSIHISRNMKEGEIISEDDLIMKRPATGISPMEYKSVIGKKVTKDLIEDHMLINEDLI